MNIKRLCYVVPLAGIGGGAAAAQVPYRGLVRPHQLVEIAREGNYFYNDFVAPTLAGGIAGSVLTLPLEAYLIYKALKGKATKVQTEKNIPSLREIRKSISDKIVSHAIKDSHVQAKWGEYKIINKIGAGGMGKIYKALNRSDRPVAIKVLMQGIRNADIDERFCRESEWFQKLGPQPHLMRVYEYNPGIPESGDCPFIVGEYITGMDLNSYLHAMPNKRIPAPEALSIYFDIIEGISEMQSNPEISLVHRDLKPHNVMLEKNTGTAKLIDFGIVKLIAVGVKDLTYAYVGTLPWSSPEEHENPGKVTSASDIYQAAIIFYKMLTGEHYRDFIDDCYKIDEPCIPEFKLEKLTRILENQVTDKTAKKIIELLKETTAKNPNKRFNVQLIRQRINNIWELKGGK